MRNEGGSAYVVRVDKPAGPTSHDVVAHARRAWKTKRIGHTGTLDPFATGLLLLCVNQATRIAEFLTGLDKTYLATARLDAFTSTDDVSGEVLEQFTTWQALDRPALAAALAGFVGQAVQTPPAFSAKKVSGERAYARARRGESLELQPVPIRIDELVLLDASLPEFRLQVTCSSGTYIRALARDIGRALATGGYLTELRRTRIGPFDVNGAVPLQNLDDAGLVRGASLSMLEALAHLPRVEVRADAVVRLAQGQALPHVTSEPRAQIAVTHDDELVAVAREDGEWLRPFKVLSHD